MFDRRYLMLGCALGAIAIPFASARAADPSAPAPQADQSASSSAAGISAQPATTAAPATVIMDQSEDIIVTALKQGLSVQRTPATVAVIDGDKLTGAAVTNLDDLRSLTPGVNLSRNNERSPVVAVRGLGSGLGPNTNDPSVGLFVDGVYAPRQREFQGALFDVSDLEVVKGTQATALGLNTTLGALNVVTRKPGHEFAIDASASYEFALKSAILSAGVDVPLSPDFAIRVAAQHQKIGGWVVDAITGEKQVEQSIDRGRVTAVWTPTSALTVVGSFEAENFHAYGAAFELISNNPTFAEGQANLQGFGGRIDYQLDHRNSAYSPALGRNPDSPTTTRRARLDVTYDIGEFGLRSLSGYSRYENESFVNNAFLPGNAAVSNAQTGAKQFTQEVRLQSPRWDHFDFDLGGYYLWSSVFFNQNNSYNYIAPFPAGGRNGATRTEFDQETESISAFLSVDVKPVDGVILTGAIRQNHQRRNANFARLLVTPGNITTSNPVFPSTPLSRTDDSTSYNFAAQYEASPDAMLYVTYGKGDKAGGFSGTARVPAESVYGMESATTLEGGVKLSRLFGIMTLNLAAFDTRVDNFQVSVAAPNNLFQFVGIDLRSRGIEAQTSADIGEHWSFNAAATYADAVNLGTNQGIPRAPKLTFVADVRYHTNVSNRLRGWIDIAVDHRSSMDQHIVGVSAALPMSQAFTRLNGEIGLASTDGWTLKLLGRNLLKEKGFGFAQAIAFAPAGTTFAVIPEQPRTVALELSFKM